ncbi:putative nuclear hormone receptor HR38 [Folsomia candida]|uniref:Putative nuclear hormone receptor HR38 n=1 Tax=Folsomia candida TaxID=158441 RepID=A0A226F2J1_FOLCA|nr:putative nuclear hormone receptor HR38 [Folsomia candida]
MGDLSGGSHAQPHHAPTHPVSLITALVRAHLDTSPDSRNKDYAMYQEPPFHEGDLPQDKESLLNHPEYIQQFFSLLSSCFDVIRAFAEKIPGFLEFSKQDQNLLLQSASLELFVLRLAYRIQPNEDYLTFCNGIVLHRDQCKSLFGDWYDTITEFSQSLQAMQLDLSTMACLEALVLVTDRHSLEEPVKVEQLQMKIIGSLRDHVTYTGDGQTKPHFFSRILGKLPELRSLSVQGLQRIFYLKLEDLIPAPPAIEAMFSSTLPF